MKKFILLTLMIFSVSFAQTLNFDTAGDWTAGSASISSYASDHVYTASVGAYTATFTGGPALRNAVAAQDGFAGALGTYSWRLRDAAATWTVSLNAQSIDGYSFKVRRWDATPEAIWVVSYSTNNGTSWIDESTTLNNTFLSDSDWKNFTGSSISCDAGSTVKIRIVRTSGERIIIDDFSFDSPLPVELSSFTSSVSSKNVTLNWATATEVDNYGFEVERSADNTTFTKVGFVAGAGNSNVQKQYSFVDENLTNGTYYYRLKQVDTDGSFEYSQVVSSSVSETPATFSLDQNYPNPFNPSTKISFALAKDSDVKLSVFNTLGEEVAVLINSTLTAGNHSVDFNATNLTSGMYLYKIQAGEFISVKKMTLAK